MFFIVYKSYICHNLSNSNIFKRVENQHFLKLYLPNYLFSETALNMDPLVRFEKTSKNVKVVDAHHYTYYLNNNNKVNY